jgi:hypothetical protein
LEFEKNLSDLGVSAVKNLIRPQRRRDAEGFRDLVFRHGGSLVESGGWLFVNVKVKVNEG